LSKNKARRLAPDPSLPQSAKDLAKATRQEKENSALPLFPYCGVIEKTIPSTLKILLATKTQDTSL
jgi:hypothetical protein